MRLTHNARHGVAYVYLVNDIPAGGVAKTVPVDHPDLKTGLVFDLDDKDRILGVEVLNSAGLAPAVLDQAERSS